jgi:hypothetical protein
MGMGIASRGVSAWLGDFCYLIDHDKSVQKHMNIKTLPSSEEIAILIKKRLKNFWGYGNLKGSIWFIGMEEGLGEKESFPYERFASTAGKAVVDIVGNTAAEHNVWFEMNAPTQRTWRPLIFILLYLKHNRVPTLSEIREAQIAQFGRTKSDHAVLELMPLPSRSVKVSDWIYSKVPLEGLLSRREYLKTYKPARVEALKGLIEKHQPKLVIFYSRSYLTDWQTIVPKPFKEVIPGKLHLAKANGTTYAVTAHPTSRGMTNQDWEEIAKRLG